MSIVQSTKSWLQLFRAHTVVLEAPMAFLGAAIGLGTVADPRVGVWLLFGVMYHLVGYSMNSYVDWAKGFDKDDERKQHHPLNAGTIKPDNAKKAIYGLTIGLFAFLFALTYSQPSAVGLSVLMVVSGLAYNYLGKYTKLKFIPISIAHTLVFFVPYYLYTDSVQLWVIFMTIAYFIHHVYQIAISGDLKDIDQDEASLIQEMGADLKRHRSNNTVYFTAPDWSLVAFYTVAILQMFAIVIALLIPDPLLPELVITAVLSGLMLITVDGMLQQGVYVREDKLKWISLKEFMGYLAIHSVAMHVISIEVFAIISISMVLYLTSVSKFIWGTYLVPKV